MYEDDLYLDPAEWDFSSIEDWDKINAVFFYEYARESPTFRELVLRQMELKGSDFLVSMLSVTDDIPDRDEINQRKKKIDDDWKEISQLPFKGGIWFLAMFPDYFPNTPAQKTLEFHEDYFLQGVKGSYHPKPSIIELKSGEDRSLSWGDSFALFDHEDTNEIFINPEVQNFILSVPKNALKGDIEAILGDFVIKELTKRQNKVTPKRDAPIDQLGLSGVPEGFSHSAALEWLGVLRRFKHCNFSWSTYLEYYDESGDPKNIADKLRQKRNKALEIIKWFDAGGKGSIKKLKGSRGLVWSPEG